MIRRRSRLYEKGYKNRRCTKKHRNKSDIYVDFILKDTQRFIINKLIQTELFTYRDNNNRTNVDLWVFA